MVTGIRGRGFKTARVCSRFECTYFVVVSTRLCPPHLPLEELPRFGPDADLACVFVHVDSNMVHGWPPLAALDRVFCVWGILPPRRGGQPLHLIYVVIGNFSWGARDADPVRMRRGESPL
jgi:hypothetical protein